MALLLNTNIDELVKRNIRGKVARAGGAVNQLVDYGNCSITDINLIDGGFGRVNKLSMYSSPKRLYNALAGYIKQEYRYLLEGESVIRDRKTILLDMHDAFQNKRLKSRFDCSISSNMLEHSPNPVLLLLNFYFITREGGYQFHAIPNYRYTYDRYRKPTGISHILHDFEKKTNEKDVTHLLDYIHSAVIKDGWQREFHFRFPVAYPFIHYHVFDEKNTMKLISLMFEDVMVDIIKTDNFSDNVVIFKNALKKDFRRKYKSIIEQYSTEFLEKNM